MMSYVHIYVFICLVRICSVESSSPWISLSASGSYDVPSTNRENDKYGKSTFQSSTISTVQTTTQDVTKPDTDRSTSLNSDMNNELTFPTTPMSSEIDTQTYVRLPGLDFFAETSDTYAIINKTTFTEDLVWKLIEHNETTVQVILYPTIKDSLSEISIIRLNFDPKIEDKNLLSFCGISNNTCEPMVEIVAQQSNSTINRKRPIVEIKFDKNKHNLHNHEYRYKCAYWNEKDSAWKYDGLETVNLEDDHFITCYSTHLTLFSVLLDPHNMHQPHIVQLESKDHEMVLTTLSIAGSFITIPCVLITMSSYFCKKAAKCETTKILLHSSAALLLTHLSFHAYHWLGDRISCRAINFLTHYSVTTFLMWAACDGVNMWRMLFNDIFNTRGRCFYETCFIVSWGFPLLTTTAGVYMTDYPSNKCHLSFSRIYEFALYLLPCFIILGSNLLFFVWMMAKVICKNSLRRLRDKKVKYILALAQVYNMVWCLTFPLLWFRRSRLIGQYLIAILVSTQGIMILTLRCAKDSELKSYLSNSVCVRWANFSSLPVFLTSNSTKNNSESKTSEL